MTFGKKLQYLRKQKGISQEQLANQLSVSRQAISKWELGSTPPDTENVLQISRLFEVSLDYLLKDEIEEDITQQHAKKNHYIEELKLIFCKYGYNVGYILSDYKERDAKWR